MKATYRGCEIDSHRAKAMGGWSEVYWYAFAANGFEITSGFGGGTVREMFREMKRVVDRFLNKYKGNPDRWDNRHD